VVEQAVAEFVRKVAVLPGQGVSVVVGDRPPRPVEDGDGREDVRLDAQQVADCRSIRHQAAEVDDWYREQFGERSGIKPIKGPKAQFRADVSGESGSRSLESPLIRHRVITPMPSADRRWP
jgi:hypothetical protein